VSAIKRGTSTNAGDDPAFERSKISKQPDRMAKGLPVRSPLDKRRASGHLD